MISALGEVASGNEASIVVLVLVQSSTIRARSSCSSNSKERAPAVPELREQTVEDEVLT